MICLKLWNNIQTTRKCDIFQQQEIVIRKNNTSGNNLRKKFCYLDNKELTNLFYVKMMVDVSQRRSRFFKTFFLFYFFDFFSKIDSLLKLSLKVLFYLFRCCFNFFWVRFCFFAKFHRCLRSERASSLFLFAWVIKIQLNNLGRLNSAKWHNTL